MLKFHQRLLILLCTITIGSFIGLGLIISHVVFETMTSNQETDLDHEAEHFINLYHDDKEQLIQSNAKSEHLTVIIKEDDNTIYSVNNGVDVNHSIYNEANPSNLAYDKYQGDRRFTYKHQYDGKDIILSGINNGIIDLQVQIWKYISLICLFVLIIIFFVVRSINRTYIRPINEVTYATNLLADGYYHVRVPESNVKETKDLFVTTNELARKLQRLNHKQKLQSNRLKTTLRNIPSSVLMIDRYGKIVVANQSYYDVFTPEKEVIERSYTDILDMELQTIVTQAFQTEKPIYEQIELRFNEVHDKYFDTSCVPILSKSKKNLYGMVLVLHDITSLKKLENLRREFVANVSHELKTPITSIKGFAETLLDGAKDDTESLDMFLNIILKESNRIETLVLDLLDLSHIEQQTELETEPVDLSSIAESQIQHLSTKAEQKDIELINEIAPNVIIDGDQGKVTQVVVNLLANAINYSPKGKEVIVRVFNDQKKHILEVQDFGIGISPEDQKHIFERFYRIDKARSRDSGGTGLGLSITKHVVEAHHGRINVDSELGEGSTFRVTFFD
ncbi:two-component system histidine kinase PnpS [Staphylococcus auricularis]|uniref:two-component system histidine kinase PnpS n=1 Tax=Staphylococcus auricularis TaxID=29379 RepID=UPI003F7A57CF